MSRGISNRARAYIRSHAEANLTHECVIQRVGEATFNRATSVYTAGETTELYEGPCRIWEITGGATLDVNAEQVITRQTKLSIPWNEGIGIRRDDEVKITAAPYDDSLVDRRFRILDIDQGGDLRATRRFTVQAIQEEL